MSTRALPPDERVDVEALPLGLRTDLMLMPATTEITRHAGVLVVRSPSNPTYWWGNHLVFDAPPAEGDLTRWEDAFERLIRTPQPASRHTAFSWAGTERGALDPFLERGYTALDSIVLSCAQPRPCPHPHPRAHLRVITDADWADVLALLVAERGPEHPVVPYTRYATARVAQWRTLVEAGRGLWFGAYLNPEQGPERSPELVATLGVFVDPAPARNTPRLGRLQEVLTRTDHRRTGLAGTLIGAACAEMTSRFGPLQFVIVADAEAAAQRLYRALGFEVVEHAKGLEKGGY